MKYGFSKQLFAKRLNQIMRVRKINQTDLAKLLNIFPSEVNRWCTGKYLPAFPSLARICNALQVSPTIFFKFEDKLEDEIDSMLPSDQIEILDAIKRTLIIRHKKQIFLTKSLQAKENGI